jgi:hypothetical protein
MNHAFSETCGSQSHMFRKKTKKYHAAAGNIGLPSDQTERLIAPRVTRVPSQDVRSAANFGPVSELNTHFAGSRMETKAAAYLITCLN